MATKKMDVVDPGVVDHFPLVPIQVCEHKIEFENHQAKVEIPVSSFTSFLRQNRYQGGVSPEFTLECKLWKKEDPRRPFPATCDLRSTTITTYTNLAHGRELLASDVGGGTDFPELYMTCRIMCPGFMFSVLPTELDTPTTMTESDGIPPLSAGRHFVHVEHEYDVMVTERIEAEPGVCRDLFSGVVEIPWFREYLIVPGNLYNTLSQMLLVHLRLWEGGFHLANEHLSKWMVQLLPGSGGGPCFHLVRVAADGTLPCRISESLSMSDMRMMHPEMRRRFHLFWHPPGNLSLFVEDVRILLDALDYPEKHVISDNLRKWRRSCEGLPDVSIVHSCEGQACLDEFSKIFPQPQEMDVEEQGEEEEEGPPQETDVQTQEMDDRRIQDSLQQQESAQGNDAAPTNTAQSNA